MIIKRYDRAGRDITGLRGLQDHSDIEMCITQYPHPGITFGLHTNGPGSIWVRRPAQPWIRSRETSLHATHKAWIQMGFEWFELVDDEQSSGN